MVVLPVSGRNSKSIASGELRVAVIDNQGAPFYRNGMRLEIWVNQVKKPLACWKLNDDGTTQRPFFFPLDTDIAAHFSWSVKIAWKGQDKELSISREVRGGVPEGQLCVVVPRNMMEM